jgi:hypothetical protein
MKTVDTRGFLDYNHLLLNSSHVFNVIKSGNLTGTRDTLIYRQRTSPKCSRFDFVTERDLRVI